MTAGQLTHRVQQFGRGRNDRLTGNQFQDNTGNIIMIPINSLSEGGQIIERHNQALTNSAFRDPVIGAFKLKTLLRPCHQFRQADR